jgi:cytidylate kinase
MAVITLSWQLGCLGEQVAEEVARQLNYTIVGKKELYRMVAEHYARFFKGEEFDQTLDTALDTTEEEMQPALFDRLRHRHAAYANLLSSLIYEVASQNKAIIKGHGGQIVLTKQPHTLHVRLTGSFEYRASEIQKQRILSRAAAEELVAEDDFERMGLIRYLFQRETTNTNWYDLIIDVERLDVQAMADIIVGAVQSLESRYPTTQAHLKEMAARALGYRVKAIVKKRWPDMRGLEVVASAGGIVTLSGNVAGKKDQKAIEQRVRSLSGVQDVVNNMTVMIRPDIPDIV